MASDTPEQIRCKLALLLHWTAMQRDRDRKLLAALDGLLSRPEHFEAVAPLLLMDIWPPLTRHELVIAKRAGVADFVPLLSETIARL